MESESANKSKLNVCMLLPFLYEPNKLIYSKIRMLSYLTHFGHQVTWIVSSQQDRQYQQFSLDSVKVYAIPYCHFFPGNSILAKSFNKIPHTFSRMRLILNIFRKGKYDLMLVQTDVFDGLVAAYIKKRYKVPFVFDLPNPLEMWEAVKIASPKYRFWYYLFAKFHEFASKRLLHQADLILAISEWLKDDLIRCKGIPESRIMLAPEGVNAEVFSPRDEGRIVEKYQFHDSKVVIYEGTLSKARKLSLLIEAFSKVKMEREGVKLLVVGEGDDEKNLKNIAERLRIRDDVIFTGQVSQSEVPDFIAAAEVGVSPVPPLTFYKFSSPTKMFEYMAMAKPVVANREIPEHKEVLEESGGGVLVPFTSDAFAEAIIGLLDDPRRAADMGRMGKDWVIENRSHEVIARQLEARYLELVRIKGT